MEGFSIFDFRSLIEGIYSDQKSEIKNQK